MQKLLISLGDLKTLSLQKILIIENNDNKIIYIMSEVFQFYKYVNFIYILQLLLHIIDIFLMLDAFYLFTEEEETLYDINSFSGGFKKHITDR